MIEKLSDWANKNIRNAKRLGHRRPIKSRLVWKTNKDKTKIILTELRRICGPSYSRTKEMTREEHQVPKGKKIWSPKWYFVIGTQKEYEKYCSLKKEIKLLEKQLERKKKSLERMIPL